MEEMGMGKGMGIKEWERARRVRACLRACLFVLLSRGPAP